MLVELKKGTWVSTDKYFVGNTISCGDMECCGNDDIRCEECIFDNHVVFSLEEVATKEEESLQKIFIDCTEKELEEIKCLLRAEGYMVIEGYNVI